MLQETSGIDVDALPGLRYTAYRQHRLPGVSARVYQALHILLRPLNLVLSGWFARLFNRRLAVDRRQLQAGLARIVPGDAVLWINPSLALWDVIEDVRRQPVRLSIYFVDPVHRLGWRPEQILAWAGSAHIASYSPIEAARLGMVFLVPHAPAVWRSTQPPDLDVVYVGSPSPKRLLWVLYLHLHLRWRRRSGHLALASRSQTLVRLFPRVFTGRVPFNHYVALCARSRGVLELHERDADGVTLRGTLCQALHVTHLCNLATTPQTLVISPWRWRTLDRFLVSEVASVPADGAPPADRLPELEPWLRANFG